MPRKPRCFLPNVPVHVVQRGNNRLAVFFDDDDRRVYLDWLGHAAGENGCGILAYALMTNHVHLLMTPADEQGVWEKGVSTLIGVSLGSVCVRCWSNRAADCGSAVSARPGDAKRARCIG